MTPHWLLAPNRSACGCLEDTRRGKRLIDDANHEMISAHLSAIGYTDLPSLKSLVQVAIHESSQRGYPALFLALFGDIGKALIEEFSELEIVVASATIYGHGFSAGLDWQINTAEI